LVKSLPVSVSGAETKSSFDSEDNSEDYDKSSKYEDNSEDYEDKSSDYEDLYTLLFEEPGSSSTTVSGGSVTIDSPFATVRSPTRTPSSRIGDALPPPPVDNVYFDPFLAILNDNERNEISTIDRTTSVSPQPSFKFNTMTSSPLPTQTTTTTTTSATTTSTTTSPTISTTGSEESGTRKKKFSPAELVKLCFLNNIGCDFNYEEANLATATLATTLPPPTISTSSTALDEKSKEYELSPEEKVRLCFQFSICDESELQEYAKSQQGQSRVAQEKAVEISAATTTTRRPAAVTTSDADKYKEIKARAAACFWQNIC